MTLHTIFSVVLAPCALRATIYMSQGPWPCNGGYPWLSSKGCTMGVEKAIMCHHGPSNIVWHENGPCWGTISYFTGKKGGQPYLTCYISPLYFLSFYFYQSFCSGEEVKKSMMDHVERRMGPFTVGVLLLGQRT